MHAWFTLISEGGCFTLFMFSEFAYIMMTLYLSLLCFHQESNDEHSDSNPSAETIHHTLHRARNFRDWESFSPNSPPLFQYGSIPNIDEVRMCMCLSMYDTSQSIAEAESSDRRAWLNDTIT